MCIRESESERKIYIAYSNDIRNSDNTLLLLIIMNYY
jgi:hypothetical protein